MGMLNTQILKAPQNWVFVAAVMAFVVIVLSKFSKSTPAKKEG